MLNFRCALTLLLGCLAALINANLFADLLTNPDAEGSYGGRIQWIDAVSTGQTTSRLFVATESSSSMFYSEVDHNRLNQEKFGAFKAVPDLVPSKSNTAAVQFKGTIHQFAVEEKSGYIFLANKMDNKLYRCSTESGSLEVVSGDNQAVFALTIYAHRLFYLTKESGKLMLHYGTIDAKGGYTEAGSLTVKEGIAEDASPAGRTVINPANNYLYIFLTESPLEIYQSSDVYDNLNSATTFNQLNVDPLKTRTYTAFGIAPVGRVFVGGGSSSAKYIAYSDDNGGNWTQVDVAVSGNVGINIVATTIGDDGAYKVYFGNAMSTQRGESDSWTTLPSNIESEQLSDGIVNCIDPKDQAIVYSSTMLGGGASVDGGNIIYDISNGLLALEFRDMCFSKDLEKIWAVTNSGVRYGYGLSTDSKHYSSFLPEKSRYDYRSVAVKQSQDVNDTVFIGAEKLHRTTNSGSIWQTIFNLGSYDKFNSDSYVAACGISPLDGKTVIIGINSDTPVAGNGRIFYSNNALSDAPVWLELDTGTIATEVTDILWVDNGSDGAVATYTVYVACEYVSGNDQVSYGVKTLSYNSHTGEVTVASDMTGASGLITDFGVSGLAIDSQGNVYAVGAAVESANYTPAIYILEKTARYWVKVKNTGLNIPENRSREDNMINAIAMGKNAAGVEVPYLAINNDIYFYQNDQWVRAYSYPESTEVTSLNWWDDNSGDADFGSSQSKYKLCVGTDHGLYTQEINDADSSVILKMVVNPNKGGSTTPNGILAVTKNEAFTIKATPADGYNFVCWEVTDGTAVVESLTSAETSLTMVSSAVVTARFSPYTKGEGDITLNKLTIQLSQDYKDKGIKDIFRDSISFDATLPENFPFEALTEGVSLWVDAFGVASDEAMNQKGKKPTYTLKSSSAAKMTLTISNVNDKRSMKLKLSKGAAFSTVNSSDGITIYLIAGGKYYVNNFDVDEKTTWKFKGIVGDAVTSFSGTYTKKAGESEGKDKFSVKGENIVQPTSKGFDFDDVTTTLQLNEASWESDRGIYWKRDTYKSPKGQDPKVQMKISFNKGTWSTTISKASQGNLVAAIMGFVQVNLVCKRADGVTWTLISKELKRESPLQQKIKLTLPKVK